MNYPKKFLLAPFIPQEINYIDNNLYSDVLVNCKGALIITAGYPGIAKFYGITPNFFLNTQLEEKPKSYKIKQKDTYVEIYTKIPIINNSKDFLKILDFNKSVCLIGGEFPEDNIGKEIFNMVKSQMSPFDKKYLSTRKTLFYIKQE